MRFLVDECTEPAVAKWLRRQNHDVISVFDEIRGADDRDVIEKSILGCFIVATETTVRISGKK